MDTNVDQSHGDCTSSLNSIDSMNVDSTALNPDVHFFVMLRYGLLALQLLPENSISGGHFLTGTFSLKCTFCAMFEFSIVNFSFCFLREFQFFFQVFAMFSKCFFFVQMYKFLFQNFVFADDL